MPLAEVLFKTEGTEICKMNIKYYIFKKFSFLKLNIYLNVLSVSQLQNPFLILTWQSGN